METQVVLSSLQVIRGFGISREQLRRWRERGLSQIDKGKWDLSEIVKFRDGLLGKAGDTLREARVRRETANAEKAELSVSEKKGTLIQRGQALQWLCSHIAMAKNGFQGLPARLAPVLFQKEEAEIREALRLEIHRILQNLSTPARSKKF